MRIVVDTSTVIAVVAGEAEKARLLELTKDATIVAPPSIDWEIGNAFSAMLKRSRITLEQERSGATCRQAQYLRL
jgi:predicted nucleic acid-binding protein